MEGPLIVHAEAAQLAQQGKLYGSILMMGCLSFITRLYLLEGSCGLLSSAYETGEELMLHSYVMAPALPYPAQRPAGLQGMPLRAGQAWPYSNLSLCQSLGCLSLPQAAS